MSRCTWKAGERAIAARIGGERVPVTGRSRGDAPDVRHPWLSVEYKHRKNGAYPRWLLEAMDQAEKAAKDDQLPIAILHTANQAHSRDLVVLRLGDFEEWFGVLQWRGPDRRRQ